MMPVFVENKIILPIILVFLVSRSLAMSSFAERDGFDYAVREQMDSPPSMDLRQVLGSDLPPWACLVLDSKVRSCIFHLAMKNIKKFNENGCCRVMNKKCTREVTCGFEQYCRGHEGYEPCKY